MMMFSTGRVKDVCTPVQLEPFPTHTPENQELNKDDQIVSVVELLFQETCFVWGGPEKL